MDFAYSPKTKALQEKLLAFMEEHVYPNEDKLHPEHEGAARWREIPPILDELKAKARDAGLWNLFLPESELRRRPHQPRIRAALRKSWAARPVAPGSLQLLARPTPATWKCWCATAPQAQKQQWLEPLLAGEIRSCFAMTEPDGRLVRRHQHRAAHRRATATTMSSTAASGGPRAPAIRAASIADLHGPDRSEEPSTA